MSKTKYQIVGRDFYINGQPTYSEIKNVNEKCKGLLMNARFIQGLFQLKNNDKRFDRFGKIFDPEKNTDELIAALPEWYSYGLRAFTIGIMGGGPCMSHGDWGDFEFGSFSKDGKVMDEKLFARLVRVIKAADELGMLVIVSYLYHGQFRYYDGDDAIRNCCRTVSEKLAQLEYDNIIIEVANEYDIIDRMVPSTKLCKKEAMAKLVNDIRKWSNNRFAVASSPGILCDEDKVVMEASDFCLFHGNDVRRQRLHDRYVKIRSWCPDKPIVCNEDSGMATQVDVAYEDHFSWGYYNNLTKQEPPTDWSVMPGEDEFFAKRVAKGLGIELKEDEDKIVLLGFEKEIVLETKERYIRVGARNPKNIDRVRFFEDGQLLDVSFDEPFYLYPKSTWHQGPYLPKKGAKEFRAEVIKFNGEKIILKQDLTKI